MIQEKVFIPLLKAIITGALFALFAAAFFVGSIPWRVFWLVLIGVCLAAWIIAILPDKKIVQRVAQSKVYPTTTRIEITAKDPAGQFMVGKFADLGLSPAGLNQVAKRLQAGASFSHAGLAGPGRPLSRSEWECLRTEFISRGLAYWINPGSHAQGVELTRAGIAVMDYFCQGNGTVTLEPIPQLQEMSGRPDFVTSDAHAHKDTSDNGREHQNPYSVK